MHAAEVNEVLNTAANLLKQGNAAGAAMRLDPLIAAQPGIAPAQYLRGAAAAAQGQVVVAETHLRETLKLDPGYAPAALMLSTLLHQIGRGDEALEVLGAHVAATTPSADILFRLSELALEARALDRASDACEQLLALAPREARAHVLKGRIALENKDFAAAEQILSAACKDFPQSATAHFYHARVLSARGRLHAAWDALEKSAKLRPGAVPILQEQARAAYRLGEAKTAQELLRAAIEKTPQNVTLHEDLAQILFMTGADDHLVDFKRALTSAPHDPLLLASFAGAARAGHSPEDALPTLNRAIGDGASDARILEARAQLLSAMGDHDAAVRDADAALSLPGQHRGVWLGRIAVLLEAGDAERALEAADRHLADDPGDLMAQAYQVTALEALGRPEAAALNDVATLTDQQAINCPQGFDSVDAFNKALMARLLELHGAVREPLHQSVRGGTQVELLPLLAEEPLIALLAEQLLANVRRFRDRLTPVPGHPFLGAIPEEIKFSGIWSVRLQTDGFHTSHVHPEGWLSSAYYVSAPTPAPEDPPDAGALQIGQPPMKALHDLIPGKLKPPKEGHLTLFPSYLWHGTMPLRREVPRITVAFDIAPLGS